MKAIQLSSVWKILEKEFVYSLPTLKPGLHVSRKDRKHRLENMLLKLSSYGFVSIW